MAYDKRITDLAAIASVAAAKNAGTAPQLLMADITFALADAVEDGRIILGSPASQHLLASQVPGPISNERGDE